MEFKNTNGRTYKIIEIKGDYTLLEHKHEFVVAYALDMELGSWSKGRYYYSIEEAKNSFNELTK